MTLFRLNRRVFVVKRPRSHLRQYKLILKLFSDISSRYFLIHFCLSNLEYSSVKWREKLWNFSAPFVGIKFFSFSAEKCFPFLFIFPSSCSVLTGVNLIMLELFLTRHFLMKRGSFQIAKHFHRWGFVANEVTTKLKNNPENFLFPKQTFHWITEIPHLFNYIFVWAIIHVNTIQEESILLPSTFYSTSQIQPIKLKPGRIRIILHFSRCWWRFYDVYIIYNLAFFISFLRLSYVAYKSIFNLQYNR